MTVSSSVNKVIYSGNSATVLFPVNYYFLENSHLKVILRAADGTETVQALTTNYTVTGAGNPAGGSITMLVAPVTGTTLTIVRNVPATQETDYLANDPFPAESHERALDKLTMLTQENEEIAGRSIQIPQTDPVSTNTILPASTSRASRLMGFSSNGSVSVSGSTIAQVDAAVATITTIASAPSGNSAGISHIAAGTGAVTTTVQTKLREIASVKDYGAVGDGVADDTTAFQNAPNGAYVPNGTYLVSSDITQKGFYRTGNATTTGAGDVVFVNSNTQLDRLYAQTLPIGTVSPPVQFNDVLNLKRHYNGEFLEYLQNPYDVIDFTNNPDTAINSYYVNFVTGNNANAGTSSGAAWKTLTYAFTTAVSPAIIYIEDKFVGTNSLSATGPTLSGNFKIVSAHASGKTLMSSMNENYTKATFNWADETNGCWSTSTATTDATIFGRLGLACFDLKYPDQYGGAMPLPQAASSAACIATPGTQFHDVAASKKFVHLIDGRKPDPFDDFIYSQARSGLVILQGAASNGCILLENIHCYMNAGAATTAGFRYRHSTTATNTSRYGLRNCLSYGASGNGFEVYDADVAVMDNCHAAYNHIDNFNYHSFQSTGTKGEYITVYEYKCAGWQPGYLGFVGQPAASTSANSSTCHDSIHIERASCNHGGGTGATVADVNGCVSVNWCIDSGPPIGGSFRGSFWQDNYLKAGTNDGMWLWGCSAHDNNDPLNSLITNQAQIGSTTGQVYVKYWRGKTDGSIIGTLKNFDGNDV